MKTRNIIKLELKLDRLAYIIVRTPNTVYHPETNKNTPHQQYRAGYRALPSRGTEQYRAEYQVGGDVIHSD